MAEVYELPIIDDPHQRFKTNLNGRDVALTLFWNEWLGRWSLTVEIDDEVKVAGIRVLPGIDLIKGLGLGIGKLALWDWAGVGGDPGRTQLPSGEFRLVGVY